MILIQARSKSSRLPDKYNLKIGDFTVLQHVIGRCKSVAPVLVLIPTNDPIKESLQALNVPYFEGSEDNVLDRYYFCCQAYQIPYFVRITADCPFIDIPTLYYIYNAGMSNKMDYFTNVLGKYLWGFDVEFLSIKMLEHIRKNAISDNHKEHVTLWARDNIKSLSSGKQFKIAQAARSSMLPEWAPYHLELNTPEDYENLKKYWEALNKKD